MTHFDFFKLKISNFKLNNWSLIKFSLFKLLYGAINVKVWQVE